ncbi:MAG: cysteine desulfurase [Candidatus Portnoybacteria bacterium]|nr:cysteine desulfurase [Candidatus Portnoybacteria bacterium]
MTSNEKKKIYLDYAATTPVDKEVFEAMKPYFCEKFGNPSSSHQFGKEAREAVEAARKQVADFLRCKPEEIIFTSGATESNNLAVKGVIKSFKIEQVPRKREQVSSFKSRPHIITSAIEHSSVLDVCRALEKDGSAEVTYLPVNKEGLVEIEEIEGAIGNNTVLVSIMYANNEIGTIQPVEEIGDLIKNKNKENFSTGSKNKIFFHTDAAQAVNYLDCNVGKLGVDLLSISAHKFYGPKGVGALFVKEGTSIARIQDGGGQESKMRAGTHNVPGIVGLGEAIARISVQGGSASGGTNEDIRFKSEKILKLKNKLIDGILRDVPNAKLNGSREKRLPNNVNISFPGAEGEAILLALDFEGIAVSTGSACASSDLKPSHVLVALGLGPEDYHSSVRFSLGKYTTKEEIDQVLAVLPGIIERLRKISGK